MICIGCAACCRDNVPVMDGDAVPERLVEDRGGRRWMRRHAGGPWCAALDLATRTCTIYEHRPAVCRAFDVGGKTCELARASQAGAACHVMTH